LKLIKDFFTLCPWPTLAGAEGFFEGKTMARPNKPKAAQLRVHKSVYARLVECQAVEIGRQKKTISQIDWADAVIIAGLQAKGYKHVR